MVVGWPILGIALTAIGIWTMVLYAMNHRSG
jgi:hypothetical protein